MGKVPGKIKKRHIQGYFAMYPRINGQVSSITLQSIIGYFFQALGTGRGLRGKGRGEKTGGPARAKKWTMQPNPIKCPQMSLKTTFPATCIRLSEKNVLIL